MRRMRSAPGEGSQRQTPIDAALIEEWALSYLGRYASTAENLRQVLRRRVRRLLAAEGEGDREAAAGGRAADRRAGRALSRDRAGQRRRLCRGPGAARRDARPLVAPHRRRSRRERESMPPIPPRRSPRCATRPPTRNSPPPSPSPAAAASARSAGTRARASRPNSGGPNSPPSPAPASAAAPPTPSSPAPTRRRFRLCWRAITARVYRYELSRRT